MTDMSVARRRAVGLVAAVILAACSARALGPTQPDRGASPAKVSPSGTQTPGTLVVSPLAPPNLAPGGPPEGPGVAITRPEGAPLSSSPGGESRGKLRGEVPVPVSAVQGGWAKILSPCELTHWVPVGSLSKLPQSQVVLDPGHGGEEPGAVGPSKLAEKTINLEIVARASDILAARGISTVLTRTGDYRATLGFRTRLAAAARPEIFISVHHNAEPDGKMEKPGSETFYQIGSTDSKRLAGIMYEEAIRALSPLKADWVGDRDAGAKWRPNGKGGDYYGILRQAREAGITAILAELAFISNPTEEALLARPETLSREAEAVAEAATRYLRSKDPGSGFSTPYPREEPAGPGGGRSGCTDPS